MTLQLRSDKNLEGVMKLIIKLTHFLFTIFVFYIKCETISNQNEIGFGKGVNNPTNKELFQKSNCQTSI